MTVEAQEFEPAGEAESFRAAAPVLVVHEPSGLAAESIRALRAQLLARQAEDQPAMVAVCGPSEGVGTTFVAVNLAIAMAQAGLNTLLIDADLRRGGIDKFILPPRPQRGLQHLLRDEVAADEVIVRDVLPNLSVLYAGGAADTAQELIGGARFAELIGNCSTEYDVTLVDTPPANMSADGRLAAAAVGASVVIARRHLTTVQDLKTLVRELKQNGAEIFGVVLNDY
jgi:capsular exopolysaccharide synthesis family protein